MRKPKNSAELFHYWASMAMPQAKCGNVSYDGPVLYSYAEPIGLLLSNNRVLISNRYFSVTTNSHQHAARVATHHMRRCSAPHITRYYNSETDLKLMHKANSDSWLRDAEYAVAELKNHPRRKKSIADRLASIVSSYNSYREFFELDWKELTSEEISGIVNVRATERAEETKRAEERAAAERAQKEKLQAADLELWREHILTRNFVTFNKMALRLSQDGTEIETTRGARVPVSCATYLWRYATLCKRKNEAFIPDEVAQIGVYKLTGINSDGSLDIGCHHIPFDELELMAKKLNFIQENSNGIESDCNNSNANTCEPREHTSVGECRSAA
jgi:hypothetical protein